MRMVLATLIAAVAACAPAASRTIDLAGAGATFPAPLYAKWAETYRARTGIGLNYQPIGSGGGVKQIKALTVDFGASDKPLKPADLDAAGLYQFPTVLGGVVPIVNLPMISSGRLHLTGPLLAAIFHGQVRAWDHPAIRAVNPGVTLPHIPITVVHRSDGSGTTFLFTAYLAASSRAWGRKVGAADSIEWRTGIGGKGNDGVAAFVRQTIGAIGYVEYAFAQQTRQPYALVRNRAGRYPQPGPASFAAAAAQARWEASPGNYVLLVDRPGAAAWPVSGATFILVHRRPADPARRAAVLRFFDWAYATGDRTATALAYAPLPASVKALVRAQWRALDAAR